MLLQHKTGTSPSKRSRKLSSLTPDVVVGDVSFFERGDIVNTKKHESVKKLIIKIWKL